MMTPSPSSLSALMQQQQLLLLVQRWSWLIAMCNVLHFPVQSVFSCDKIHDQHPPSIGINPNPNSNLEQTLHE